MPNVTVGYLEGNDSFDAGLNNAHAGCIALHRNDETRIWEDDFVDASSVHGYTWPIIAVRQSHCC